MMKRQSMKKISVIASIIWLIPALSLQASAGGKKTDSSGLDNRIRDKLDQLTIGIKNRQIDYPRTLLIARGNKLVYEKYFFGAKRDRKYAIFSVSKPFTSAITGIVIDKGYIKSEELPIEPFFPEYKPAFKNGQKGLILIKHLLTLSSGFEWDEGTYSYEDMRNTHVQMEATGDWVKFILSRPLKDPPGTRWVYNTGNTQILSAIIKKTTGMALHQFARKHLFEPLKITDFYWNCDPRGNTCAGGSDGGLRIKARDFIKLGMLYLNKGIWNDQRVVSEHWIRESTKPYIKTGEKGYYGYLWSIANEDKETGRFRAFFHSGSGGHFLIVFPTLDLAVAWNSKKRAGKSLLAEIIKIFQPRQ